MRNKNYNTIICLSINDLHVLSAARSVVMWDYHVNAPAHATPRALFTLLRDDFLPFFSLGLTDVLFLDLVNIIEIY